MSKRILTFMNNFQQYLTLYELLVQSPKATWESILQGQRDDILYRLRETIWKHLPENRCTRYAEVHQRFRRRPSKPVETFSCEFLQQFTPGRLFVVRNPTQLNDRQVTICVETSDGRLSLRMVTRSAAEFTVSGCLFLQRPGETEWSWIPFEFLLEYPPSLPPVPPFNEKPADLKRLDSLPYVDEFTQYGQTPRVPHLFHLSHSKLRSSVFDSLLQYIKDQGDNRIIELSRALQCEWRTRRDAMRRNPLYHVPGRYHPDVQLWELDIPRQSIQHLQIGERVSVRCTENEMWLYIGFIHRMTTGSIYVSFQIPHLSTMMQYTFPILRFHMDASYFYYMTLGLCKATSHKNWLYDQPESCFELIGGPVSSGKTRQLVLETVRLLQDPFPRILVITPTEENADQFALELLEGLKGFTLSRPCKEIIFRLPEWDRTVSSLPDSVRDLTYMDPEQHYFTAPTKLPFRVWIMTARVARVLDRIPKLLPFTDLLIDNASYLTEPETMVPLTAECSKCASRIVMTGDLFQPLPQTFVHTPKFQLRSLFERLWRTTTTPRVELTINYRSIPQCVDFVAEWVYKKPIISHASSTSFTSFCPGPLGVYTVHTPEEEQTLLEQLLDQFGETSSFVACSPTVDLPTRPNVTNVQDVRTLLHVEADVGIVSLMADSPFWNDPRVFNLLICRPRGMLLVLGSPDMIRQDPYWQHVLAFCVRNQTFFGHLTKELDQFAQQSTLTCQETLEFERALLPEFLLS